MARPMPRPAPVTTASGTAMMGADPLVRFKPSARAEG
jgi:hypothetical protein